MFDDSLAPEGKHVMSMFTQWVPHTWSEEPHLDDIDALRRPGRRAGSSEVAPGFTDSILHRQVIGPYQMEHEYGLIGGNIFHGELSSSQLFHARPAAGYADLRTPISGLYQAGSSAHGGGGVTGIPGHNVTKQVLGDRKRAATRAKSAAAADRWDRLQPALPKAHYVDPAAFALERERVLTHEWSCAGRVADLGLDRPGRLAVLDVLGESVLVTRTADGQLAAHYNVCRHRGSQLLPAGPDDPVPLRPGRQGDPVPVPLLDLRPRRPRCCALRTPRTSRTSSRRPSGCARLVSTAGVASSSCT